MSVRNFIDREKNVVKAILSAEAPIAVATLSEEQTKGTQLQPLRNLKHDDKRYMLDLKANNVNRDFTGEGVARTIDGFHPQKPLAVMPSSGGYFLVGSADDLTQLQDWTRAKAVAAEKTR